MANAQFQLRDAEGRLQDAAARYRRQVGAPPDRLDRPKAPLGALPADADAAVELALRANPTVQRAEAEVEAARAQARQSQSGFYPQFDLEVSGNTTDNQRGIRGKDSAASAMLVMRYNLSRGGGDIGRAQEAVERLSAANERLGSARRDTERDTRLAWSELTSARARALAANDEVLADARGRDAFRRQYDLGRSRILDLLDSERDYYNSLQLRTSQEATALFGIYKVLQSAGVLLRTLKVKAPDEAYGAEDTRWAAEVALGRQPEPFQSPAAPEVPALPPGLQLQPPPELQPPGTAPPLSPEAPAIVPSEPRRSGSSLPTRQSSALPPDASSLASLAPAAGGAPKALPPIGDPAGDESAPAMSGPVPPTPGRAPPMPGPGPTIKAKPPGVAAGWPDRLTLPPIGDPLPFWPEGLAVPPIGRDAGAADPAHSVASRQAQGAAAVTVAIPPLAAPSLSSPAAASPAAASGDAARGDKAP